jgi:hypothetical protein
MEHEELLRQIVAETTKGLEPLVKALADIEQAKQPKNEVKLATREELNSVMSQLIPGYQPTPKPENEKTPEDKETEAMLDRIMPYMQ